MIEEVVNSILEAEDVAKKRIAEAEQKASEIVAAAEIEAEQLKKQAAKNNKALFAEKTAEADKYSEEQANNRLKELNSATDKEIAVYRKNIDKAVKVIIEAE
ncbi:MAG: hypothetical protein NC099_04975 [Corallococcus sp.]|nr:hypothetical protein [Bacillota bacterium]MCM1533988.1 hypothetical protein [Corallococcus sp.]